MFNMKSSLPVFQTQNQLKQTSSLECVKKQFDKNKMSMLEVEEMIKSHPAVLHAVVGGVHDPLTNEVIPGAFVALKASIADQPDVLEELQNYRIVSQKRVNGSLCLVVTLPQKGSSRSSSPTPREETNLKCKQSTSIAPPAA